MAAYRQVVLLLGQLPRQIGRNWRDYEGIGLMVAHARGGSQGYALGIDGTLLFENANMLPSDVNGMTIGGVILVSPDMWDNRAKDTFAWSLFELHEYVHVLQFREAPLHSGLQHGFWELRAQILRDRNLFWQDNPLEVQALSIEHVYATHPALPAYWLFPW